ncbi:Protein POLLEN DEFECTIVE IN GUIDANCE 1 [Glycine max]|nr:Protein POLLEN DEFECTIVE IN GUIDANCE 1 [Glycine max]
MAGKKNLDFLQIFDKLCQNFVGDVLSMLFHSAEELARCPPETESMKFWIWRFNYYQAITLSTCTVSYYNALPALPMSNNFSEIKSYVFKGYSKDNAHNMVYSEHPLGLSILNGYRCDQTFINCQIQQHISPIAYSDFLEVLCK